MVQQLLSQPTDGKVGCLREWGVRTGEELVDVRTGEELVDVRTGEELVDVRMMGGR